MEFNLASFDADVPLDESNFNRVTKPGRYHLIVQGIDDSNELKVIVDFDVLGGTESDQVGRNFRQFYTVNDKDFNLRQLFGFAVATGLTTQQALQDAKANREPFEIPWEQALGADVCAEVEMHEYNGNVNARVKGLSMYHPKNAKARDIPRGQVAGRESDATGQDDPYAGLDEIHF